MLATRHSFWLEIRSSSAAAARVQRRPGYNVIVVGLEEDPSLRMVGNLVSAAVAWIDSVDARSTEMGAPVRVVFEELDDEIHLPRWVRA